MPYTVYTIGHSTHKQERFIALLTQHGITAVCDVRSRPFSRVNPQFNLDELKHVLPGHGIRYIFLGAELGARSDDPACYKDGKVQYLLLARTAPFIEGLTRVKDGVEKGFRIVLMCAEKEPLDCHRAILVSRYLAKAGFDVRHIHADGSLESHTDALKRLAYVLHMPQGDLFDQSGEAFADVYLRQEQRIAYDVNAAKAPVESPIVRSAIR